MGAVLIDWTFDFDVNWNEFTEYLNPFYYEVERYDRRVRLVCMFGARMLWKEMPILGWRLNDWFKKIIYLTRLGYLTRFGLVRDR